VSWAPPCVSWPGRLHIQLLPKISDILRAGPLNLIDPLWALNTFSFGGQATPMALKSHKVAVFVRLLLPIIDFAWVCSNLVIATSRALWQRNTPHTHLRRKNQLAEERFLVTMGLVHGDDRRVDEEGLIRKRVLNWFQEPRFSTNTVSNASRINSKTAFLVSFSQKNQLQKHREAESQLHGVDLLGTESQDPVQLIPCCERISEHI